MAELTRRRSFFDHGDMTQGGIMKNIVMFAVPLLIGNLFQQLYNMVDTWVIGQTGQNGAYAAVGSVGPIINMLLGFFVGFSTGAGVVISQYFGAKEEKKVSETVHTALLLTLILAVVMTLAGLLLTPTLLDLMLRRSEAGSEDVYPYARAYLTIYFAGVAGLLIYNIGAGILRAVGDSVRPFLLLVFSTLTNIGLDMLFVFVFGMGVEGVALATIIAQGLSAVLVMILLLRSRICIRFEPRKLAIHWDVLWQIVRIGIPGAIQMSLTAFSNIFVQSYIAGVNGDQTFNLSGWTTYSKIDMFIFLPVQSLALSVTTFVGQNLGVGNVKRAKRGTWLTFLTAIGVTVPIIAFVMLNRDMLSAVFNKDPNVVEVSRQLLLYVTPFYVFPCVNQTFSASLRGAGDGKGPMLIMLGSFVLFRQIYLYVMTTFISNDLIPVAMGYPAGWFVCAATTLLYYRFFKFEKHRITGKKPEEPAEAPAD